MTVTAVDHETGDVNIRGYDNTDTVGVFDVFLFRAKVIMLVSIVITLFVVFGAGSLVRSLLSIRLSSLFALRAL